MKIKKLKVTSTFVTLALAGTLALAPVNVIAESHRQGSFISETVELNEVSYNQYVVKEGDTLSIISYKICQFFKEPASNEYWPALAFLNNYPRVSKPGDIIYFPTTFEDFKELNESLRSTGWTARYISKNDVYRHNRADSFSEYDVKKLLAEIYGPSVTIDDNFVNAYLKTVGMNNKNGEYNLDSLDNETFFKLIDWIPSLEEVDSNNKKRK